MRFDPDIAREIGPRPQRVRKRDREPGARLLVLDHQVHHSEIGKRSQLRLASDCGLDPKGCGRYLENQGHGSFAAFDRCAGEPELAVARFDPPAQFGSGRAAVQTNVLLDVFEGHRVRELEESSIDHCHRVILIDRVKFALPISQMVWSDGELEGKRLRVFLAREDRHHIENASEIVARRHRLARGEDKRSCVRPRCTPLDRRSEAEGLRQSPAAFAAPFMLIHETDRDRGCSSHHSVRYVGDETGGVQVIGAVRHRHLDGRFTCDGGGEKHRDQGDTTYGVGGAEGIDPHEASLC